MAVRFYLVPTIGTGVTPDSRRPAYFSSALDVNNVWTKTIVGPWKVLDYGDQPVMLVAADVGAFLTVRPTSLVADETARLLMAPESNVTGGTTGQFYVNVFSVAP